MSSPAAVDTALVPTPSERALLHAWRRLPTAAAAALLALNVAFLSDHGLTVPGSTPEASSVELSDPLDEGPETS